MRFSGKKRSGLNTSGSGKFSGSRCNEYTGTDTSAFVGIVIPVSPIVYSSDGRRFKIKAGGYNRRDSDITASRYLSELTLS